MYNLDTQINDRLFKLHQSMLQKLLTALVETSNINLECGLGVLEEHLKVCLVPVTSLWSRLESIS